MGSELIKMKKTTEELTGTKIKYGSGTYSLLCYAAMKSNSKDPSFSTEDVIFVLNGKLKNSTHVNKSISVLLRANCITSIGMGRWTLTPFGVKTRKILGWYGNTVSEFEFQNNQKRREKDRKRIAWEDEK